MSKAKYGFEPRTEQLKSVHGVLYVTDPTSNAKCSCGWVGTPRNKTVHKKDLSFSNQERRRKVNAPLEANRKSVVKIRKIII